MTFNIVAQYGEFSHIFFILIDLFIGFPFAAKRLSKMYEMLLAFWIPTSKSLFHFKYFFLIIKLIKNYY